MIVINWLSEYNHFILLKHPYMTKSVFKNFNNKMVKLHGFPKSIVTDLRKVFLSTFWKELFEFQGSKLKARSSYHPQMDGQNKVVSIMLEQYLRCICHEEQVMWVENLT